jgi:hypothetical protein
MAKVWPIDDDLVVPAGHRLTAISLLVDSVGYTSTDRNRLSTTNNREDGTKNDCSTARSRATLRLRPSWEW